MWYNDSTVFRSFQNVLIEAEILDDAESISAFSLHPQRWNSEFKAWKDASYPTPQDEGWDDFVNDISSEEEENDEEDNEEEAEDDEDDDEEE